MPTYLLTWNPRSFHWDEIQKKIEEIQEKGFSLTDWSCGRSKRIHEGDRLFMIRLGVEPRGIFASGYAKSDVYEEEHWNKNSDNKSARYIDIQLDVLLNPDQESILPRSTLREGVLNNMHWDSQSSGIGIPEDVVTELEIKWAVFLASKGIYEDKTENRFYQSELLAERQCIERDGYFDARTLEDARQRITASIVQRQGQSGFRRRLLCAYCGRCAITSCDVEPALEAAHIIPYKGIGTNHPANGLLLRADLHTLFDLHLVSIHPGSYEIVIAPNLALTCYNEYSGKKLTLPKDNSALPDQTALTKHYELFLEKCRNC